MPLITLDIPQHKMPLVKEFIEGNGIKETSPKSYSENYYNGSQPEARHYLPTTYTSKSKGWEYFRNELEFE